MLPALNHSISTGGQGAVVSTAVGIFLVSIVAGLESLIEVSITASRRATVSQAAVSVFEITVITFFDPGVDHAIAAAGR